MEIFIIIISFLAGTTLGCPIGWLIGHRKVQGLQGAAATALVDLTAVTAALHIEHRDRVTGLADRTVAEQALDEATRHHTPISIGIVDINNLKHVNDTFGHHAGDEVLAAVGQRLLAVLPVLSGSGLVARLSGDEFVIISEVRDNELVAAYSHVFDGAVEKAAIGIASSPEDGPPRRAMECADIAMYSSKSTHSPITRYTLAMGVPEGTGSELPSVLRRRVGRRRTDV